MTPYRSVVPSAAFALNGSGGFHPIAVSFDTSAFSRSFTIWPVLGAAKDRDGRKVDAREHVDEVLAVR